MDVYLRNEADFLKTLHHARTLVAHSPYPPPTNFPSQIAKAPYNRNRLWIKRSSKLGNCLTQNGSVKLCIAESPFPQASYTTPNPDSEP